VPNWRVPSPAMTTRGVKMDIPLWNLSRLVDSLYMLVSDLFCFHAMMIPPSWLTKFLWLKLCSLFIDWACLVNHSNLWVLIMVRFSPLCFYFQQTILPASARDVYYRDEIGNISTSNLRDLDDSMELELRPRFPLFGGWKTHYVMGYNVPSYQYLYYSGVCSFAFYLYIFGMWWWMPTQPAEYLMNWKLVPLSFFLSQWGMRGFIYIPLVSTKF
jgi:hypothetical protein